MPRKPEQILENNHHAYCLVGDVESVKTRLFKALETEWKIKTSGNPDFSYQKFTSLSIDEARKLKEAEEKKAIVSDGRKIFVLEADSITVEAQNSLLKIFEEPTENTHFFLIGACVKNLIPTLASRLYHLRLDNAPSATGQDDAVEFLKASVPKRLALVKKLADEIKDEKKTRNHALVLLQRIEGTLYQKAKKDTEFSEKLFEDLEMCRDYMSDRSASVKMLLEYAAIVIPKLDKFQ